jgi:hypothetical protein
MPKQGSRDLRAGGRKVTAQVVTIGVMRSLLLLLLSISRTSTRTCNRQIGSANNNAQHFSQRPGLAGSPSWRGR